MNEKTVLVGLEEKVKIVKKIFLPPHILIL